MNYTRVTSVKSVGAELMIVLNMSLFLMCYNPFPYLVIYYCQLCNSFQIRLIIVIMLNVNFLTIAINTFVCVSFLLSML